MKKSAPEEPPRLPVKLGPVSNGEYWPRPLSPELAQVQRTALALAEESARRLGVSRRDLLRTTCGAATVFLALNQLGCSGGRYRVRPEAALEPAAADAALSGDEFIFDVQTHAVAAERAWWDTPEPSLADFLRTTPQARCDAPHWARCFTDDVLIREVFLDSDTSLAVLSALWGAGEHNPLHAEEAALARERVARMEGGTRLRIHGIVQPQTLPPAQQNEYMQALAETWGISAWKLYPVWGPERRGWWLTDEDTGQRVIRDGLALGIPLFAVHKGLPLPGMDPKYTSPLDVGPVARMFPQATFLIYHSGYEPELREGPYNPRAERGVDALIRSLEENGIGKDGNVYAELGSLWREVMKSPDEAAHVLGKLLVHLGEERILWGTDAIWYGSPQDQIQAFRAFEITPEFQERYGYPALTPERKRKILGLNAARVYGVSVEELRQAQKKDTLSRVKTEYLNDPRPSFQTYGPRTRREMLRLLRLTGGQPG